MTQNQLAVLLLAHGSPDSPDDVPEFMKYITGGRPVSDAVIEEVRHRYSLIGKSPLTEITLAQAEGMQRELGLPVYVGMRNWKPFVGSAVREIMDSGAGHILAICLAPQNSSTSVGLYKRALMAELQPEASVHFIEEWHDHPLLVQAFAERLEPVWRKASTELGSPAPVIFTAHSVPTRTIQAGDPYERQTKETAHLVGQRIQGLPAELRHFAFQSQGMSGGPWLGPTVESVILHLKKEGHRGVVIAPIGFVCDHVEVLYDVDIGFRQFATEEGLKFWRTESLNTSSTFISALADLASRNLAVSSGQKA
ncbi:MAG: ferrochelatase [Candidatus Angelobacter sp. Gp1-AA117]|nr:MAG: ferrochelatase [Candidatus Angelobacter sp. Gp1-AA117]